MAHMAMRILAGWVALLVMAWPAAAVAAVKCQTVAGHRLCLESVKRSAKYFWQYRAVVSVDGQPQPEAVYNCQRQPAEALPNQAPQWSEPSTTDPSLRDFVCQTVLPRR